MMAEDLEARAREAVRATGPGTTRGGRAEAGWFDLGMIAGAGPAIAYDVEPEE